MKTKFLTSIVSIILISALGMPAVFATVYIDARQQSSYSTQNKKMTKSEKKRIERDRITREIIRKEQEIRVIRKSRSLRAGQRRIIIKNLKDEIKILNEEYRKVN